MNSFLDLHSDVDYRNTNRPYYTGTWEYTNVASDFLIPWQVNVSDSRDDLAVYTIDTDGVETDITSKFYGSSLITGWTKTGSGTWSSSGNQIVAGTTVSNDQQDSNTFSLTAGDVIFMEFDSSDYTVATDYTVYLRKGAVTEVSFNLGVQQRRWFDVATTGSDYTIRILYTGAGGSVLTHTPLIADSLITVSGRYRWYDGSQLYNGDLSGVFYLKVTSATNTWYSDWCDTCGFSEKTKISLSSSYDYGGIKYVAGYIQWMYKDATVRRAPKAEIEITGDKLNGAIIEEKKTSAVRYMIKMKCTEAEYEALVHSIGGTLTITDQTGKSYTAVNLELSDPTWYRANGVVELSFVDDNNISVWTMNNSNL
jgi:hypothetical protein